MRSLQHSSAVASDRLNMRLAWLLATASRQALNPNALHQFALADCSATSGGVPIDLFLRQLRQLGNVSRPTAPIRNASKECEQLIGRELRWWCRPPIACSVADAGVFLRQLRSLLVGPVHRCLTRKLIVHLTPQLSCRRIK